MSFIIKQNFRKIINVGSENKVVKVFSPIQDKNVPWLDQKYFMKIFKIVTFPYFYFPDTVQNFKKSLQ